MFWPCPPELGMIAVSIAFISGSERFPDIKKFRNKKDNVMETRLLAAEQALGIPRNPWEIKEDASYP